MNVTKVTLIMNIFSSLYSCKSVTEQFLGRFTLLCEIIMRKKK